MENNGFDLCPELCPACRRPIYEANSFPASQELKNAAQLNWMMHAAQKAFFPTYLDIMRGMDDDALIACIQELAKEEYVRGFLGMPSMIGNLPERLKERRGKNENQNDNTR